MYTSRKRRAFDQLGIREATKEPNEDNVDKEKPQKDYYVLIKRQKERKIVAARRKATNIGRHRRRKKKKKKSRDPEGERIE